MAGGSCRTLDITSYYCDYALETLKYVVMYSTINLYMTDERMIVINMSSKGVCCFQSDNTLLYWHYTLCYEPVSMCKSLLVSHSKETRHHDWVPPYLVGKNGTTSHDHQIIATSPTASHRQKETSSHCSAVRMGSKFQLLYYIPCMHACTRMHTPLAAQTTPPE